MKHMFFLISTFLLGNLSIDNANLNDSCTVSSSTSFEDCNGDSHTVTVTNTADSCSEAFQQNRNDLKTVELSAVGEC